MLKIFNRKMYSSKSLHSLLNRLVLLYRKPLTLPPSWGILGVAQKTSTLPFAYLYVKLNQKGGFQFKYDWDSGRSPVIQILGDQF